MDSAFNTARSREYDADVRGRCRQEPASAYFPGANPSINVGATASGASSIPPWFTAAGIAGTITAAGLASGAGGGIGAGTAVAVGAAVAAGAGAGVLTTGGDDPATSSVVAGVPTSTTSTIPAGSTSSTTAPNTEPGPTTSTTTTPGAPTTTVPGGSTTTTTPASTSTTPAALDASCFTVAVLGACRVPVDATCVVLPVDRYEWILDLTDRWRKVEFPDGPTTLTHTWGADDCDDDGETLRFRLKAHRADLTSTAHKNLFVPGDGLRASPAHDLSVRLRTHLALPGRATGQVSVNATPVRLVDNVSPVEMRVPGRRGTNTLTAFVVATSGEPGTWRFALDPIVPGSVRIVSGNVLTREPDGVVFRLAGHVGERVELTFVLRE